MVSLGIRLYSWDEGSNYVLHEVKCYTFGYTLPKVNELC